jgi:hypothetical protein
VIDTPAPIHIKPGDTIHLADTNKQYTITRIEGKTVYMEERIPLTPGHTLVFTVTARLKDFNQDNQEDIAHYFNL